MDPSNPKPAEEKRTTSKKALSFAKWGVVYHGFVDVGNTAARSGPTMADLVALSFMIAV